MMKIQLQPVTFRCFGYPSWECILVFKSELTLQPRQGAKPQGDPQLLELGNVVRIHTNMNLIYVPKND